MTVRFESSFQRLFSKIKDAGMRERVKLQITRIAERPDVGKPMRYQRSGTREVYLGPYRVSYLWIEDEDTVVFLDLYHKDEQ